MCEICSRGFDSFWSWGKVRRIRPLSACREDRGNSLFTGSYMWFATGGVLMVVSRRCWLRMQREGICDRRSTFLCYGLDGLVQ